MCNENLNKAMGKYIKEDIKSKYMAKFKYIS